MGTYNGTLTSGLYLTTPGQNPVLITATGYVTNPSGAAIRGNSGVAWTVTNRGTVKAPDSSTVGINLAGGGTVINGQSGSAAALIEGGADGVALYGSYATVTNFGTILGTSTTSISGGVLLQGTKANLLINKTGALIQGNSFGVQVANAAGTVQNAGTINGVAGRGVALLSGGSIGNSGSITGGGYAVVIQGAPGTVFNTGVIRGGSGGVRLGSGGSLTNGSSAFPAALIQGSNGDGVVLNGASDTVTNFGNIFGMGTAATAAYLNGTVSNTVINKAGALIFGGAVGVSVIGAAGSVNNAGSISGGVTGITLAAGGTITNSGRLTGGQYAATVSGGAASVGNTGTIQGNYALVLRAGGTVNNSSVLGLIKGSGGGVSFYGDSEQILNSGTILATNSAASIGATMRGTVSNSVTNGAHGLIQANSIGLQILNGPGTVVNAGRIDSAAGGGLLLKNGGSLQNSGAIFGAGSGVYIGGASAAVTNSGTIYNTDTSAGSGLTLHGTAANTLLNLRPGSISGQQTGVYITGAAGTVTNNGTILGHDTSGVSLMAGGSVTNSGLISSANKYGVYITGTVGTVRNTGSLSGFYAGLHLHDDGLVTNLGAISGTIFGVVLPSGGTIVNGGTASTTASILSRSAAILADSFLNPTAAPTNITNFGTIAISQGGASAAIEMAGTIVNGASNSTAALIQCSADGYGVVLTGTGIVTNFGTIQVLGTPPQYPGETIGGGDGIQFLADGTLLNEASGLVSGTVQGVFAVGNGHALSVVNAGIITGTAANAHGAGIRSQANTVSLTNLAGGQVIGADDAIAVAIGATVTNSGLIQGGNRGINLGTGSTVNNSGSVVGATGVQFYGASSLTNAGTITGTAGTAVLFSSGDDLLVVEPGAVFSGTVDGAGGTDEVEFTQPGTVSLAGLVGFETIALAAGAPNTLTVTDANFTGVTGGRITIIGAANGNTVNASGLSSGHAITFTGGAGTDVLTGGAGADMFRLSRATLATATVTGGAGKDTLVVTSAGDVSLAHVSGVETIKLASTASNSLSLRNANFVGITGGVITVNGGSAGNTIDGSALAATNAVTLNGGAGADRLIGGRSARLTGSGGSDLFVFTTPGTKAVPDANTITDFTANSGTGDGIAFSNAGFNLGLSGASATAQALPATLFTANASGTFDTHNDTERFVYDTATGDLYYGANGYDSTATLLVAHLNNHPTVTAANLFYVT